jgi:IS30 family transposase
MEKGHSRKHQKSHIPNRVSISERPEVVNKRKRIGDWENDLMVSRQSTSVLNVLADRKSRYALITKLAQKTAEVTKWSVIRALIKYPAQTITYDNGSENTKHEEINKILDIKSYFCNPYHSWEKGTVENTIGLIRRWLPKKTDLAQISETEIMKIENWLNNRPRKCLSYKTPLEVFVLTGGFAQKERSVALAG